MRGFVSVAGAPMLMTANGTVSILPVVTGMAGRVYLVAAVLLGAALLRFSYGMVQPQLPATAAASKPPARRLLQATIVYLPLLFALMMANSRS